MKTLLVLRHAKASRDDEALSDHERELTKRGLKAAERMGELLKNEGLTPDCVLTSSATRALKTAEIAAQSSGCSGELKTVNELYLAEPPAYLDALRRYAEPASRVLVVGHNPGIETLIYRLTGEAEHMPTAGLAECELPIDSWSELGAETRGQLRRVWRPKGLEE